MRITKLSALVGAGLIALSLLGACGGNASDAGT